MQPSFPLACRSDPDVVAKAPKLFFFSENFMIPNVLLTLFVLSDAADYGSTRVYLLPL
jgi:hypothetical protein